MYHNEQTPHSVNKILQSFFIVFIIVVMVILGMAVLDHIDGDTMTATASSEERQKCGDAQAQEAMKKAGVKVPVNCKH